MVSHQQAASPTFAMVMGVRLAHLSRLHARAALEQSGVRG
jgi:hypothetical protein